MTRVERGENEDTYGYDANGNMLERVEDGVTWTQTYNAENRLSSVSDGTDAWSFTYDGDGRRVRQVGPDGEVTLYLGGGAYEVRDAAGDAEAVKYYGIAGQRVALSGPDGLQYLLTDHLGSVSAVLDGAGNLLAEQRYTPFGEARFEAMLGTTDFGYTGQRLLAGTGLMDYNARFYAPGLGRWTQPDSIVGTIMHSQFYNRYSYVNNDPLNSFDPSGHCQVKLVDGEVCGVQRNVKKVNPSEWIKKIISDQYGIDVSDEKGVWTTNQLDLLFRGLVKMDVALNGRLGTFTQGAKFTLQSTEDSYGGIAYRNPLRVEFRSAHGVVWQNLWHEIGHIMDYSSGGFFSSSLSGRPVYSSDGRYVMGGANYNRNSQGYDRPWLADPGWPNKLVSAEQHGYCAQPTDWCVVGNTASEEWGDLIANYVAGNLSVDAFGVARKSWIERMLSGYYAIP